MADWPRFDDGGKRLNEEGERFLNEHTRKGILITNGRDAFGNLRQYVKRLWVDLMALFAKHPTMQVVLSLNPMAPVINAVRTMFFGGQMDWIGLGFASAAALVLMLVALAMFQRVERSFADVV